MNLKNSNKINNNHNHSKLMTDFLVSSISSILASTILHPIDVVKTQYQIMAFNPAKYGSAISVKNLINNINKGGPSCFYRGLSANLISYPLFWGIYFQISTIPLMNNKYTQIVYIDKAISSFGCAILSSIIVNPFFVLSTRKKTGLMMDTNLVQIVAGKSVPIGNTSNSTYLKMISQIYREESYGGFMKGLGATVVNNSKFLVQFPLYDYIYEKTKNPFYASIIGKTISTLIFYPCDLIRTNQRNSPTNITFINAIKTMYQDHYKTKQSRFLLCRYYNGVFLYGLTTIPNFVLMMLFRDFLIKKYK